MNDMAGGSTWARQGEYRMSHQRRNSVVLSLLALAGCGDKDLLAVVGKAKLHRADLAQFASTRSRAAGSPTPEALSALVDRALLAEGARRAGVHEDAAVQARLRAAEREILAEAFLEKELRSATDDGAIRKRYEESKESLARRQVHVAQIVLRAPSSADADAKRAAMSKATDLYSKLRDGADFEKLAAANSEDAVTAGRGGDLGPLVEGRVDPHFFEEAAALKKGDFSKPFETPFGVHIVKALEDSASRDAELRRGSRQARGPGATRGGAQAPRATPRRSESQDLPRAPRRESAVSHGGAMNLRVVVASLLALGLNVLTSCSRSGVQPPEKAAVRAPVGVARQALDALPIGCDPSVQLESLGAGWVMGPYQVPGDGNPHAFTSLSAEAGPGLLVLQNGDGRGANEAASATALLAAPSGPTAASELSAQAGTSLSAIPVNLAGGDALTVTASGGGTVRVLVASLGATMPCSLANLNEATGDGAPKTTSQTFNAPAGALGILVLRREDAGPVESGQPLGSASLNGGPPLTVSAGAVAQTVSLSAENTLTLTASGAAGAGFRALVLNVAKRPSLAVVPPAVAWRTDAVLSVEGTAAGANAVEVGWTWTTPSPDGTFAVDMPLSAGLNSIVVAASDECGNVVRDCVNVVSDESPPAIDIQGVFDGLTWGYPTTITWSAYDDNLLSAHATLDGVDFPSGGVVETEGPHVLEVTAVDRSGNQSTRVVHFVLDLSPPVVTVEGVWDGMLTDSSPVVANISVSDPNLVESVAFLNGVEYLSGTPIAEDGDYWLWIQAKDSFYHTTELNIRFGIDTEAPAIEVRGVEDGQFVPGAVAPSFAATDAHLSSVAATLDGVPFTTDTQVSAEGGHRLVVSAMDAAGHLATRSIAFVIDTVGPVVTVTGVESGDRKASATIAYSASDANLLDVTGTLDGAPFSSGATVTAEGYHEIFILARDRAGNQTTVDRAFIIDATPPQLIVLSPLDGAVTDQDSVEVVTWVQDDRNDPGVAGVLVGTVALAPADNHQYRGVVPLTEYENTLDVAAADQAGNVTHRKLTVFSVRKPDACTAAGVGDSLGAGWIAGPFDVPGDSTEHVFEIPNDGGPANGLLVMRSGDGRGGSEAIGASAWVEDPSGPMRNPRIETATGGARLAVAPVLLSAFNKLTVVPWMGGMVRVGIARIDGEVPCSLVDATATCSGGVVTRQFTAPAGGLAAVVLTPLPASQPNTAIPSQVRVELNGESVPVDGASRSAMAVSLQENNTLTVEPTSCGVADGYRVQVLGMDMGPDLSVTAPVYGSFAARESVGVTGTSLEAASVDVSGVAAALAGGEFTAQVPLNEGENAVVVAARDGCGDVARQCRLVIKDTVKPVVEVSGVTEGAAYGAPVAIQWTVAEEHLSSTAAKLDGVEILYGSTVSSEGEHVLEVTAVDRAGNSGSALVHFAIDTTKPQISIAGVSDGLVTRQVPVVPTFSATDAHALSATATLDGAEFTSGVPVSAEGDHTLVVTATDSAGNTNTKTVSFVIDLTPPSIGIAGVSEGERRNAPATLTYSASDLHLATVTGALDAAVFASGGVVSSSGAHELVVSAVDRAGNTSEERRHFVIDTAPPAMTVVSPVNGLVTSASSVEVVVSVSDDGGVASASVGAVALVLGADGKYRGSVSLAEGANILDVVAIDAAGNAAHQSLTVTRDSVAPQLSVSTPAEGARVAALSTAISGVAKDGSALTVTVNGMPAGLQSDGSFSATVALTAGANAIAVVAKDAAGNVSTVTRNVRANGTAPKLLLSALSASTSEASIDVKGTATPADATDAVQVTVNGVAATVGAGGAFSAVVVLAEGPNSIQVVAVDGYGLQSQASAVVTRVDLADAGTPPAADAGTPSVDASTPSVDAGVPPAFDAGGSAAADAGASPTADAGTIGGADAGAAIEPVPSLFVDAPAEGAVLGTATVAVTGHVEGGTLPIAVTIDGAKAAVSSRYYSAALAIAEGDHAMQVVVTDARGRTASVQRTMSVDRTAPYLTVNQPSSNPAVVTSSPYRLEGTVGDAHLSSVTVNGNPAVVLAGMYGATVSLSPGNNDFFIEATDLAGNRTSLTQRLTINGGTPPTVQIVEPMDGATVASRVVTVRVSVTAFAAISSVQIGAGPATVVSPGVYQANVALALGSNTITATATDANGLTGSTSITASYSDAANEPLAVTGVDPADGTTGVEPNALVSVAFNKAVDPSSLSGKLTVLRNGAPLAGGYLLAPGGQVITFSAKDALPEGETLTVKVSGLLAQTGPGLASDFASRFTVRRPLTLLRGVVTDDGMQPLSGVKVELVGTSFSTTTGSDGNWAIFGVPEGTAVVSYTGGTTSDGRSLPQVKRKVYVTAEKTTRERVVALTPTDKSSAQYVNASQASTLELPRSAGGAGGQRAGERIRVSDGGDVGVRDGDADRAVRAAGADGGAGLAGDAVAGGPVGNACDAALDADVPERDVVARGPAGDAPGVRRHEPAGDAGGLWEGSRGWERHRQLGAAGDQID